MFSVLGLQNCNLDETISGTSNEQSAEMRIIRGISGVAQALGTRERAESQIQEFDAYPVRQGGVKCPLVENPCSRWGRDISKRIPGARSHDEYVQFSVHPRCPI